MGSRLRHPCGVGWGSEPGSEPGSAVSRRWAAHCSNLAQRSSGQVSTTGVPSGRIQEPGGANDRLDGFGALTVSSGSARRHTPRSSSRTVRLITTNCMRCPDQSLLLFSNVVTSRRLDPRRSSECREPIRVKSSSMRARQAAPLWTISAAFSNGVRRPTGHHVAAVPRRSWCRTKVRQPGPWERFSARASPP